MTIKNELESLLIELDKYAKSQTNRADFALTFIETIESLDDLPFSILDEAREWQYKIETEGDSLQSASNTLNNSLKIWIKRLITTYA
tara:strand:+ start:16608 stop:16868 length:261 start_codon:yes stop_codon:yes gene_type:complete